MILDELRDGTFVHRKNSLAAKVRVFSSPPSPLRERRGVASLATTGSGKLFQHVGQFLIQLAQKSTSTYFPLNELRLICLPLMSGNKSSGACLPIHFTSSGALFFCLERATCLSLISFIAAIPLCPGNLLTIPFNNAW